MAKKIERASDAPSASSIPEMAENTFDFEAYRKEVLSDPKAKAIIETFLKNRHREWEEDLAREQVLVVTPPLPSPRRVPTSLSR